MPDWVILLLEGAVVGFGIAVPVGPVALLSIQRTLHQGAWVGFIVGLAAASADTVYGAVAAFSLAYISDFLIEHQQVLRLVGGLFLIAFGVFILTNKREPHAARVSTAGLVGTFVSSFVITLANPVTALSFIAIFASLGLAQSASTNLQASALVAGVFLGAASWWFTLSAGAALLRHRVTPRGLLHVQRWSGYLIIGFGVYGVVSFFL